MKLSLLLPVIVTLGHFAAAAPVPPPEVEHPPEKITRAEFESLPPHPRLLANTARWAELRASIKSDPIHREMFALLRRSGDEILALPQIDYTPKRPGENILAIIRDAEHRILTLAMLFRLTDEKRYLEGARNVMHGLTDATWTPGHFLDPATGSLSLGVGYDWLYDELTPAERDEFAAKIKTAAIARTTQEFQNVSFLWADFNWNQICNTGLTLGALALAERDPELARYVTNRALALVPRAAGAYAPDGVYPEGPGYWAYGTLYHVMLIEALRSSFHTDGDLEKFPGFLASSLALEQLTGPSGDTFDYSDNRGVRKPESLVFWFARENGRPDLALAEWARVQKFAKSGDPNYARGLPLALLWMPPTTSTTPPPPPTPLDWRGEGHQPVAVLRSAWNDPAATWFAIKGGTANYSHAHMDAGSFVFEAAGVRWAIDPFIDDYQDVQNRSGMTHADLFSYAQESRRWAVFRIGPEGHNILRVNGARQNVDGHATISPIHENTAGASVEVDLTATYAGQVAALHRQATLHPDRSLELLDTWQASIDHPAEITWQWLTAAHATPEPGGVLLAQSGQTLHLRVAEADHVRIEIQPVATLLSNQYDSPDPGWTRLVLHVATKAGATGRLQVTAAADSVASP